MFYRVLLSFTGFSCVVTVFYCVSQGFTGFDWVCQALPVFLSEFYWL